MTPVLLRMIHFMAYDDETFDFFPITMATVTGTNGAGKSTFCTDAITWALYGKGSRGTDKEGGNYVSIGQDSCTVEFTFDSNGSRYKVVRSLNARKNNRMSLNLFVYDDKGQEIPMSGTNLTSTQAVLDGILKMSYKTFVSSSMVFQGKSDEFSNAMSDAERKEALVNILNVSEWDDVMSKAKEEAESLRKEIRAKDAIRESLMATVAGRQEYADRKKAAEGKLKDIAKRKAESQSVIEKNREAMFRRNEISKDIERNNAASEAAESRIARSNADMKAQQASIERNNKTIASNAEEVEKQQAILTRKEEIDKAAEEEKQLSQEVQQMLAQQRQYSQACTDLEKARADWKVWKASHEQDVRALDERIASVRKQAEAVSSMPCAGNNKLTSSCPLLAMAREAESSLAGLISRREELAKQGNPHTNEGKTAKARVEKLVIDQKDIEAKQRALSKASETARMKPVLESAARNIGILIRNNTEMEEQNKASKERINEIRVQSKADKEEAEKLKAEKSKLLEMFAAFDAASQEQSAAETALAAAEREESAVYAEIGSCEAFIEQAEKAKKELDSISKELEAMKLDLSDTEVLIEACSKKSGVPALIVENAVPELESIANEILDTMMDGRLQLRFDTQVETNKGTMREAFRITVLDDGDERPYSTYSGAEKFVTDFAIRIALSKFLARRNGTHISLFVLDEGVSCADASNRREVVNALRNLSEEFSKILFVTHIEEMKDCLDQRIDVVKEIDGSHIRVCA